MTHGLKSVGDMATEAKLNVALGYKSISFWTPDGWTAPAGFPRRELMCCPTIGGKTWRVDARKLLKWCEAHK